MGIRDAQFLFRTGHRVGLDSADLGAFESRQFPSWFVAIIDAGAFAGIGYLQRFIDWSFALVFKQIRRAGEYGVLLIAIEQAQQHESIGVGVRHHFPHFAHDDGLRVPGQSGDVGFQSVARTALAVSFFLGKRQPHKGDLLHFQSRQREAMCQFEGGQFDVHEVF